MDTVWEYNLICRYVYLYTTSLSLNIELLIPNYSFSWLLIFIKIYYTHNITPTTLLFLQYN